MLKKPGLEELVRELERDYARWEQLAAAAPAVNLFAQAEPTAFLNSGKPAAPAAAANRFVQPKPAAPPGRH